MNIHKAETEIHPPSSTYEPVRNYQDLADEVDALKAEVNHIRNQPRYQVFHLPNTQTYQQYNNWVEAGIHGFFNLLGW